MTPKVSREDFYTNLLTLLEKYKDKQYRGRLVANLVGHHINKFNRGFCFCVEGLISLALGGTIETVPEEEDDAEEFRYYLKTPWINTFKGEFYTKDSEFASFPNYFPTTLDTNYLLSNKDLFKLNDEQIHSLSNLVDDKNHSWNYLNDEINITFDQFYLIVTKLKDEYAIN
jgi:hypothetical protein